LPLIGVNHIEGHIHAVVMEAKRADTPVELPAMALVASGGHTHLFEVRDGFQYRLLGKTRDDAAGEAFDKVAKLLGFGYPGGPIIDHLAPHGDPKAVRFTFAKMKGNALDFSFSGLKTAEAEVEGVTLHLGEGEADGLGVAMGGEVVDDGAAGIAKAEELGDFVEGFAGGVVAGLAEQAVLETIADLEEMGVAAAGDQRHRG